MTFLENNLYGWGGGQIAMPRAASGLHPDRSRKTGVIVFGIQPGGVACRWRSSPILRLFWVDYPWRRIFSLGILSSLIIAYLYFLHVTLPVYQDRRPPKPVEVVVAMQMVEPRPEVLAEEPKPAPAPAPVRADVKAEPVKKAPQKLVFHKPREVKPLLPLRIPPEPKLQPAQTKRRLVSNKAREPQPMAAVKPVTPEPSRPKAVTIPPPKVRQRNYTRQDRTENEQLRQTRDTDDVIVASNKKTVEAIAQARQRYLSRKNPLLAKRQPPTGDTAPSVSFQAPQNMKIRNPKPGKANQAINKSLPPVAGKTAPDTGFAPLHQQVHFAATPSALKRRPGKRYALQQSNRSQALAARDTGRDFTFQSQQPKANPELTPPVSGKFIGKANRSVAKESSARSNVHNFLAAAAPGEVDPADLVSLKAFGVCKNPQREFQQKTQLAAHLLGPARIQAEGVIFFINYTESGYTIELQIYNPGQRPFRDRCEVLELALDRIVNRGN